MLLVMPLSLQGQNRDGVYQRVEPNATGFAVMSGVSDMMLALMQHFGEIDSACHKKTHVRFIQLMTAPLYILKNWSVRR